VPGDDAHSLTDAELRTYAAEIAVLGGLAASAECRYERFRESNVVIAGCGLLLPAVAGALLRMGLARPRGAVVDGPPTDLARLREHLALLRRNDDRLDLVELDLHDSSAAWRGLAGHLGDADLVPVAEGSVHDQVKFQAAMSCPATKSSRA